MKKSCCGKKGDKRLIGIIVLVLGLCTVCLLLFPYKLWLIFLGFFLIYIGYKLFLC